MNHDIALKLKAAGLRQTGAGRSSCGHFIKDPSDRSDHGKMCKDWAYYPTDEELITEIDRMFVTLGPDTGLAFLYLALHTAQQSQ